ncbi:MAG: hypothetical protein ABIS50_06340 [Luteolibacter sp.]|uniref:hypothetical protein n=1 Tax=Luteolibacter sp. TaxID=1962973 RepID=UPI003263AE85
MKPTDLADATARALDLLPPGDPAHPDPRLRRDPGLVDEARLTRETAADVWLAVSPLHVAPPDVLHAIMAEIDPPSSVSAGNGRPLLRWLAVSGWAAAAVLAVFLWQRPEEKQPRTARSGQSVASSFSHENPPETAPAPVSPSRDSRRDRDILRLQTRLAEVRSVSNSNTPRVMSLTAPGGVRRTPEEARRRVQTILTNALRSALEVESGAPSDPSSLVIERGWLPGGVPVPGDGGVIRHRNFPEQNWQELGLLRSAEGEYYDSLGKTIWSADPDGRGFIGRKTNVEDDVARFTNAPAEEAIKPLSPRTSPEGFIVENPTDRTIEVIIDQLPAPAEGTQHIILATDSSGHAEEIPLSPSGAADSAAYEELVASAHSTAITTPTGVFTSSSTSAGFGGTLVFTLQNFATLSSFQLVERATFVTGQPDTIIIEGTP